MQEQNKKYDLVERTSKFGRNTLLFLKQLPETTINRPLISQLTRSSTSVAANYIEADGCSSKKDFHHKILICKREANESMHWFDMISAINSDRQIEAEELRKEAHELVLIFAAIFRA